MATQLQLQMLIGDLSEALRKRDQLLFDEEYPHELGEPCSPSQIATLERILGKPLPPSYRAFLELHNGWKKFVGGARLLAVEDQESAWVKKRLEDLDTLFFEDEEAENPFKEGVIPVLLGEDERSFLVLDPRTFRQNGEMDFVQFDLTEEERRFEDFTSFLQHKLNLTQEIIQDQLEGSSDKDEE
jgi:SMI1/KNR4 family protein SUKH-1